jgi:hypothetical protein
MQRLELEDPHALPPTLATRWIREAVRLHHRYQREIVEACGLCPWAERARVDESFRPRVLLQSDMQGTAASLAAIDDLMADVDAEVAVLIFPRLRQPRLEFERFVARVREADAARHPLGDIPFVFAGFHPEAVPDTSDPERLIPFLRRTPDPTIQLLRTRVLERVRGSAPGGTQFVDVRTLDITLPKTPGVPLRERIAQANFATMRRIGLTELTALMDDIRTDRIATYRALEPATVDDADDTEVGMRP